ncbi:MAG: hypothetical protein ABIB04_00325 [Patescibacteria group bacterium]
MLRSFFAIVPFVIVTAVLTPSCVLSECTDGECAENNETSYEETGQVQDAVTVKKYKTFYVSNPPSSANNYTRKANKLKVTATIPSGGKITAMHIFDMYGIYAMMDIYCSGTTSCTGTKTLPGGCRNYGSVPVIVEYSYSSTSPKTPSLTYWFYDCK